MRKILPWYLFFILILFFSSVVYGAIPTQERIALIALYNATNGDSWTNNSGWKSPPLDTDGFAIPGTEGAWYGVNISGDHVIIITLSNNQLMGSIPPELGNLGKLKYLYLFGNQLSGDIPPELGNLGNLIELLLYSNQLSGTIPPEIGDLANLEGLILNNNKLSDAISTNLMNLSKLLYLNIKYNCLYANDPGLIAWLNGYDPGWDNYQNECTSSPTYTLYVRSLPETGVNITVSPVDNANNGNGSTNFTRDYNPGTEVTLTAPQNFKGSNFIRWTVDGQVYTAQTIQVTIAGNHTAAVYYETITLPEIYVNRNQLNLGYIIGSTNILLETFSISNTGGGTLNWNVSTDLQQISLNPASGINNGVVEILVNPVGLIPGKFEGVIYVSDPLASNSPVEIFVKLQVKDKSKASLPFGEFSTPVDGSTVSGSVPVTGWVLGDTGIESVKIYREEDSTLVYIGDAFLVEGARPDVEETYPDYPMNYKAGWGYMMLTNFLPDGGTGVFEIHATATDREGSTSTLGVKTITVDNANAVKPFGAIDTPAQGGSASGSNYRNHGWVLTPLPNIVPEDGSTINVYIDGVYLGHPVYNIYRADIFERFPGYANSSGAHAYFDFDTTAYSNGIHTVYWTAVDSGGNSDGIGSRYFSILNTGSHRKRGSSLVPSTGDFKDIPDYPDDNGSINIEIKELERVEIDFFGSTFNLSPLPIGSTLDTRRGIFYWQPGPGFVGDYEFEFVKMEGNETRKIRLNVRILPGN